MLYVVAWPVLGEADDTALRRLRAQYHPREADLIGPHFTLVFGAALDREPALRAVLGGLGQRPFWFMIERIVWSDLYLYAEPSDGAAELTGLHEALNPVAGGEPFEPHITLGLFQRAAEAEQVARIVGRQHLPMTGRVEALALLRRDGDTLATLDTFPYGQIICPTDAPSRRLTMIVAQEPTQSLATPHRPLAATIEEIAAAEKINSSYVSRLLRVTLLAPTTVEAILDGGNRRT